MKDATQTSGPQAGDILIAHPMMPDNPFARTLIYLHTFSEDGALGFILNRPMGQTLSALTGQNPLPTSLQGLSLYFGGPVQSDHFILARFAALEGSHRFSCEINPDPAQFLTGEEEPGVRVCAFMGYSGWSAGQLEEELARNDWGWAPSDAAFLDHAPGAALWELLSAGDTRWQRFRDQLPRDAERN